MTSKRKPGRPQKPIDAKLVKKLAEIQATPAEIGAVCECDESTIRRRFAAELASGKENGKISLRRAQFKHALAGNSRLLIFLGKQYLGQSEKLEAAVTEVREPAIMEAYAADPALLERALQFERDLADAELKVRLGDQFESRERSYLDPPRGNGEPHEPDMEN